MLHAVAIVTAVSYDYNRVHLGKELPHYHPDTTLPMFSQYRHWTWVSTMFVVVCTILSGSLYHFFWTDCSDRTDSLNGTSFIHGPRARVVTLVPKSSASPLHFYPWDSVDPDMGPLCISREIGQEMWEGPREGKLPDMSESIVGAEGKAMTWTDRQCGKALHRKPCTCTEEGPGMAEAKTANMIEWAQGQMIYEMTERVERAEDREGPSMAKRGPKHGRGKEGRHIRVGPGPENVCDYRKDREGPGMLKAKTAEDRAGPSMAKARRADIIESAQGQRIEGPSMAEARRADIFEWAQGQRIYRMTERIERAQAWPRQGGPTYSRSRGPKYGRGKEGRHNRLGPGPENLFDNRKAREGPGMVKARTAEVIERANGERIYRMTKMIERAQAWPRQGGPRPKIKWGPYFRELLYGSINHDEALTRPRLIYTEDLEGAFYGRRGKYGRSNPTGPGQDDLQDDRGGLGPAVSWGRGAEIQGGGLLGKDYWMARYTRIMDYRPDVIIDCD
ncbi:hypothetical protein EV363DRAFT_1540640 [Boletus edulis]|nr:hypothetical protein EV363DRAFT_1540640 [Boletus edulis]